jgi:ketosteroid isomerase-like protein
MSAVTDEQLTAQLAAFDLAVLERDADLARTVLHDDYQLVLVQPGPARIPRQQWLVVLDDYVVHDYEVQQVQLDVDADLALVLQRVRMRATVLGQDRSGIFVISDTWRRVDGRWRVWRRHSTPLSAGDLPGA